MRLFTPGHSAYTDTLILYGFCKALYVYFRDEFRDGLIRVGRIGQQYVLDVKAGLDEIIEALSRFSYMEEDRMYSQLTDERGPLGLFEETDVREALKSLRDKEGLKKYLNELTEPEHSLRSREGRGGGGKTMKLPLMPLAGKYQHKDLTQTKKYSPREYKVCDYCRALALGGFLNSVYAAIGRQGRVIIMVSFEGLVDADYFSDFFAFYPVYWEQFFEELRLAGFADQIPVRTITYIVVSLFSGDLLDAMARAQAGWHSTGICFAGRRGAPEVRGFCELELTSFIDGLYRLYKLGIQGLIPIMSLIYLLVSQGDADSLDSLFSFLSSGSLEDMYRFARGSHSTLQRAKQHTDKRWKEASIEFYRYFPDIVKAILGVEEIVG